MLAGLLSLSPPRTEIWRSVWSWSRPPQVKFSLVLPTTNLPPHTGLKTVQSLPNHIQKPDYALSPSGRPNSELVPSKPVIWSPVEIIKIRESCYLANKILTEIKSLIEPGVKTEDLDHFARELITIHNAYPSLLNYRGYPKSIYCSVNNVIAHGVPNGRPLEEGDIVKVGLGLYLSGYHGSSTDTFTVGEVDPHALKLIRVTRDCLQSGVSASSPGNLLSSIGRAVHQEARRQNCAVVPNVLGHGIGEHFTGPPDIYHCLNNVLGRLLPGMIFTVEPVISEGDRRLRRLEDGWSLVTQDNSRTAQVGLTVLVTSSGPEILTK